jgi:hypothetical protein
LTERFRVEDLIDKILLIETLNSTLVHFILSSQVEGSIDPDRVDSLAQGLQRTRKWIEETTVEEGVPPSTANILSLIVKRLSQLESLLPKLSQRAKQMEMSGATQEILSLLEGTSRAAQSAMEEVRSTSPLASPSEGTIAAATPSDSGSIPLISQAQLPKPEPYKKVDVEDDTFGLVGQASSLVQQYSKRCHVLLPIFWLEVLREIHKYRSQSQYMSDAVEIPAQMVSKIIRTLLTEAPGARLLQDLLRTRTQESTLEASEVERVERSVAKYFVGLEPLLKGDSPDVPAKLAEAQNALDGFGWGGPELEKRLIKRINQQCQETLQAAESVTDDQRKVIYAETTKLLCKLQHAILAESRLTAIMAEMKP